VLDGDPAPTEGTRQPPTFAIYGRNRGLSCGQMVRWIRMSLVREAGLGTSDIVLDGDPAPPRKGA